MEMTLGFYCSPKREVLSPKSFMAEAVLKLWGKLPDFCCGFMSFEGLNVSSGECEDTHRCRCVSRHLIYVAKWSQVRFPVCLSAVSKRSRLYSTFSLTHIHVLDSLRRAPIFLQSLSKTKCLFFFITNSYFLACAVFS